MKQKTITTSTATIWVVEYPVEIKEMKPTGNNRFYTTMYRKNWPHLIGSVLHLPDGNWKLIGRLPELTEEQINNLGFESTSKSIKEGLYNFHNTLRSKGILFENPLGRIHPHHPNYTGIAQSVEGYLDRSDEWKEAQQKVWNRNNTYIFKQLK